MDQTNTQQLKILAYSLKDQVDALIRLLQGENLSIIASTHEGTKEKTLETGESVLEGIFDGKQMIGPDGKTYSVPPNYASKSKLVEGDTMKLTITIHGSFIYKQIKQIPRQRITGELTALAESEWVVMAEGKPYKILTASVTFYKGNSGDTVVILVPEGRSCSCGAVENIIKKIPT